LKRDAAERKLISIIMLQEQFINEMRDKSMSGDKEGLQSLVQLTPIGQGGVYDHSLSFKLNQPANPGKASSTQLGPRSSINYAKGTMGFELFNDVSVSDIKTDSIYNINDNDDIMVSSSDSDDELAKVTKSQMQVLQKNLLKKTKKLVKAIGKLEKYKYENTQLRNELDGIMDIANQWLKEKETLLERIKDLEATIEFLKND